MFKRGDLIWLDYDGNGYLVDAVYTRPYGRTSGGALISLHYISYRPPNSNTFRQTVIHEMYLSPKVTAVNNNYEID